MIDTSKRDELQEYIRLTVPSRARAVRETLGMNHTEFAKRLNVSRNNVYYYESGERTMSIEYLLSMSKSFNINPNWVLGLSENMTIL